MFLLRLTKGIKMIAAQPMKRGNVIKQLEWEVAQSNTMAALHKAPKEVRKLPSRTPKRRFQKCITPPKTRDKHIGRRARTAAGISYPRRTTFGVSPATAWPFVNPGVCHGRNKHAARPKARTRNTMPFTFIFLNPTSYSNALSVCPQWGILGELVNHGCPADHLDISAELSVYAHSSCYDARSVALTDRLLRAVLATPTGYFAPSNQ